MNATLCGLCVWVYGVLSVSSKRLWYKIILTSRYIKVTRKSSVLLHSVFNLLITFCFKSIKISLFCVHVTRTSRVHLDRWTHCLSFISYLKYHCRVISSSHSDSSFSKIASFLPCGVTTLLPYSRLLLAPKPCASPRDWGVRIVNTEPTELIPLKKLLQPQLFLGAWYG